MRDRDNSVRLEAPDKVLLWNWLLSHTDAVRDDKLEVLARRVRDECNLPIISSSHVAYAIKQLPALRAIRPKRKHYRPKSSNPTPPDPTAPPIPEQRLDKIEERLEFIAKSVRQVIEMILERSRVSRPQQQQLPLEGTRREKDKIENQSARPWHVQDGRQNDQDTRSRTKAAGAAQSLDNLDSRRST